MAAWILDNLQNLTLEYLRREELEMAGERGLVPTHPRRSPRTRSPDKTRQMRVADLAALHPGR